MSSVNQCNFIGNVGKIETRYMPNGEAVCNVSLAVNETWKDKSGEKQERVEWVRCVIYRKLAEVAEKYMKVGSQLYISGKMQTKTWEKDGVTRYTTEIIVNEMTMLGGKPAGENQAREPAVQAPAKEVRPVKHFDDFDSDIPF